MQAGDEPFLGVREECCAVETSKEKESRRTYLKKVLGKLVGRGST